MLPFPIMSVYGNTVLPPGSNYRIYSTINSFLFHNLSDLKLYGITSDGGMIGLPNTNVYNSFTLCATDVEKVLTTQNAGSSFSAIRKTDGKIYFCGTSGAVLGGSTRYPQWEDHTSLFTIVGLDPLQVKEINAYNNMKLNVVMNNGDLWCCGKNNVSTKSSFGTGNNTDSFGVLVKVPISNVTTTHGNCYISGTTLFRTGTNSFYEFGNGTTNPDPSLVQIATNVVDVRSAWQGTYYLNNSGTVYGAGTPFGASYGNEYGQGSGMPVLTTFTSLSTSVQSIESCLGNMSLHIITASGLFSTGLNRNGSFGNGNSNNTYTFVAALPLTINASTGRFVRTNESGLLLVQGKLYRTGINYGTGAGINNILTEIPMTFLI